MNAIILNFPLIIWIGLGQNSNDIFPIQVLQFSLDNKFGHTQKPTDEDGGNFHADHHLFHVKNFGIYNCLTDMYFDTGCEIDVRSESKIMPIDC